MKQDDVSSERHLQVQENVRVLKSSSVATQKTRLGLYDFRETDDKHDTKRHIGKRAQKNLQDQAVFAVMDCVFLRFNQLPVRQP